MRSLACASPKNAPKDDQKDDPRSVTFLRGGLETMKLLEWQQCGAYITQSRTSKDFDLRYDLAAHFDTAVGEALDRLSSAPAVPQPTEQP